jgi:Enoyl-CoA hydratase/carnithine racemase
VALSRNVLRKQAFEMLVTGEFISAQEAKARGLINRVAEPEQLDAELRKLVAAIISKPRVAVAMGKDFSTARSSWVSQRVRRGESNHGVQHDGRSSA